MLKSERGVTLIEMVLALAIAGLLAAAINFGRDNLRTSQQFSEGVDQTVNLIADVRNQAAATVGRSGNSGVGDGNGANEVIYGKLLSISTDSKAIISTETFTTVTNFRDFSNTQVPWGVAPNPAYAVAPKNSLFLQFGIQGDGTIHAFYSISSGPDTGVADENQHMTAIQAGVPFSFIVQKGALQARITVDQFGDVSRVFL